MVGGWRLKPRLRASLQSLPAQAPDSALKRHVLEAAQAAFAVERRETLSCGFSRQS